MRKHKILVIDDDDALASSLKLVLEDAGYGIRTAGDGQQGLDALREQVPDLIILDVKMPTMSGLGFLRNICDDSGKPRHPVIILTARANMQGFFDNLDIDGFLLKPCRTPDLLAAVGRVLADKGRDTNTIRAKKLKRKRVLIAEDDEDHTRTLLRAFSRAGFLVDSVSNGSDAVGKTIETTPDVLVVKEVLSQMNGHAVAKTLSAIPKTKSTPIVLYDEAGFGESASEEIAKTVDALRYVNSSDAGKLVAAAQDLVK